MSQQGWTTIAKAKRPTKAKPKAKPVPDAMPDTIVPAVTSVLAQAYPKPLSCETILAEVKQLLPDTVVFIDDIWAILDDTETSPAVEVASNKRRNRCYIFKIKRT